MRRGHRRSCERLWNVLLSSLWEKKKWHRNKELTAVEFEPGTLDPKSQSFQPSHEALDVFSWLKRLYMSLVSFFFYMDPWATYKNVLHLIPHGNAREDSAKRASTRENMAARAQLFYRYDTYTRRFYRYETVARELIRTENQEDRLYLLEDSVKNLNRLKASASNLLLEFFRGQSLINASVDRGFLFQVVTSLLFSTRVVFSLVPSYEGTNSSIVPSYEGTNSSIVPSYEGTNSSIVPSYEGTAWRFL